MDSEPPNLGILIPMFSYLVMSSIGLLSAFLVLTILLLCSGLVSGSEVAFFSLSPTDLASLNKENGKPDQRLLALRERPRKLLATILISNNLINIAIVIISDFIVRTLIPKEVLDGWSSVIQSTIPLSIDFLSMSINFLITIVGVTFLLVLFGEVAPKIYANINNIAFARVMSRPMSIMVKVFNPLSSLLVLWSNKIESRYIYQKSGLELTSKEDLDRAILLTVDPDKDSEEADMLRGIIKFGNVSAKQIMCPRVDVIAIDKDAGFHELMTLIREHGYSRIPVYNVDFDEIVGILYIKDLLGLTDKANEYKWQRHIREDVLYVPESKKIDALLREFQQKHLHLGVVVDEFGGSAGIVTLEDIMEEIIGEIKDEFDEDEEVDYVKINNNNYIFEGKTLLNDVERILDIEKGYFDSIRGGSDSLAGIILEVCGNIPKKDKEVVLGHLKFKIISVSKRRIEKVHVTKI